MNFVIIDQNGTINLKCTTDDSSNVNCSEWETFKEVSEEVFTIADQCYVDISNDTILQKPLLPASAGALTVSANGLVTITVPTTCPNGFPIGVNVEIEGEEFTVEDGEIQIPFADPGTYEITVSGRNYLPVTLTVEVVDEG